MKANIPGGVSKLVWIFKTMATTFSVTVIHIKLRFRQPNIHQNPKIVIYCIFTGFRFSESKWEHISMAFMLYIHGQCQDMYIHKSIKAFTASVVYDKEPKHIYN